MEVFSPCRGICQFDATTGWCKGCGRTRAEQMGWNALLGSHKLHLVRRELKLRLKQMGLWPMKPHLITQHEPDTDA